MNAGRPLKLMQETDLVVCAVEMKRNHPELFHYTKRGGFEGILSSETLRASHFADMEDKREVWLLKERLIVELAARFDALSSQLNRHRRRAFDAQGRGTGGARRLLDALYGATFGSKDRHSKIEAFMTSFSTHATDDEFVREHGHWSQWERYAGPDGYCIVFDTAGMCDFLGQEFDTRYWVRLALEPVRYSAEDAPIGDLLPELIEAGSDIFLQYLRGFDIQEFAVPQFLEGSTLLKDAGYREERELRIVAIPGTMKLMERGLRDYPDRFKRQPLPPVRPRDDGLRYVTLFEQDKVRLPVKRIIVGPAPDANEGVALAQCLCPTCRCRSQSVHRQRFSSAIRSPSVSRLRQISAPGQWPTSRSPLPRAPA